MPKNALPVKLLLLFLLSINQCLADGILIDINRRLVKASITQGQFQQEKRLKFLTRPLISKGHFIYHQQHGVIWQTETPLKSTVVMNNSVVLSGAEKQAIPPAFGHVFNMLLGGEVTQLSRQFIVTGQEQKASWTLQLIPNDELLKKAIQSIKIAGDSEVREWELQEVGGNISLIRFSQISHPDRLSSQQQSDFEKLGP